MSTSHSRKSTGVTNHVSGSSVPCKAMLVGLHAQQQILGADASSKLLITPVHSSAEITVHC